jgi:hypothetical protein
MNVVGYDVAAVGELPITESAFAILGDDFPIE